MESISQKVVVNLEDFHGYPESILKNGASPYSGKTEREYASEGYTIMTWEEYIPLHENYLNTLCGDWEEISEEQYDEMLNILPPMRWSNGGFYMSERYTADVTGFYQIWHGKYYTSRQRLSVDRREVIASLEQFIERQSA